MTARRIALNTLFAACLLGIDCAAYAATNDELEARIIQLEAQIAALVAAQGDSPRLEQLTRPETKWPTPEDADGSTSSYSFGGYVKLDGMFSSYSSGDLDPSSPGTQFYIPATIPVGDAPSEGPDLNMQARETRIDLGSHIEVGVGTRFA